MNMGTGMGTDSAWYNHCISAGIPGRQADVSTWLKGKLFVRQRFLINIRIQKYHKNNIMNTKTNK